MWTITHHEATICLKNLRKIWRQTLIPYYYLKKKKENETLKVFFFFKKRFNYILVTIKIIIETTKKTKKLKA